MMPLVSRNVTYPPCSDFPSHLYVYANAKEHRYYDDIKHVDSEMLAAIKRFASHLEVKCRKNQGLGESYFTRL